MNDLAATLTAAVNMMKLEFTLYGFTLSFWDVFLWSAVAGIVAILIWRFFQ